MRNKLLLITILFIIFPIMKVSATGITASPANVSLEKGNKQTVTVTVTNLAALLDITTSNSSVASISKSTLDLTSNGSGSVSGTFVITGSLVGNANVTIKTKDASDFTNGDDYSQTITIKVTVIEPTTTTTTTTTKNSTTTTQQTQNPTTNSPTTRVTERQEEPPVSEQETTTTTTELITNPITDNNSNGIDDEIELSSLKIVGFPITFDPKVNSYSINIGEANAIYLNATPLTEGAIIDKNGEVSVEGLDSIELNLTYNEKKSTITIILNRNNKKEIDVSPKTDTKSNSKISIFVITFLSLTTLSLLVAFIYKEKLLEMFVKVPSNKTSINTNVEEFPVTNDIFNSTTNIQETTINNEINNDTNMNKD